MKNILISCISLFNKQRAESMDPIEYSSEGIKIKARQTNEACAKFLLKKLKNMGQSLNTYIRVQSNGVEHDADNFTMTYFTDSIAEFCQKEKITVPEYVDCFLGKDESAHRYDRILNEISQHILRIAGDDTDVSIYLDVAGGKRDNFIFIQLMTKLMSYYNYEVHSYYADIDRTVVNTDLSFRHMKILDAVNVFIRFGSVTPLRECFENSGSYLVRNLLRIMEDFSNSLQLCSTDLVVVVNALNHELDMTERDAAYNSDDLFVIKAMIPLIRRKFNINVDDESRGLLNIIRWCLENNLIQQALTIYNERIVDLILDENIIAIGTTYAANENTDKLTSVLNRAYNNMQTPDALQSNSTREMRDRFRDRGNLSLHLKQTMGAVFFREEFTPEGFTVNIDYTLCAKILTDIRFAYYARNRVNHAAHSNRSRVITALLSRDGYPFSSYRDAFIPDNLKKDLLRALDNLDDALNSVRAPRR